MPRNLLPALIALLNAALPAMAGDVQNTLNCQSSVSSDGGGPLDLVAELNYDDTRTAAPIAVVMHGYSPVSGNLTNVRANAQRLRDAGFFVASVAMRGRDGSDGARDSGGVEIYDIYDAVEAIKTDAQFAGLIEPTNIHITGYSGGGGNVMSALTKFPDYFRLGSAFFGMSDYGFDATNGWYLNGAGGGHRSIMNTDIGDPTGGDPAVVDRYHARASNLASKNNPYSEIHLFVNDNETTCPKINDTTYRDNAVAAQAFAGEFDKITVHIGGLGVYEDFDGDLIDDPEELQDWPHGFPTADQQNAAELWYRNRLLSGAIPQPVLNSSDELFVAGFVKTRAFELWLGDGQNAAGLLDYALSSSQKTFELQMLTNDLSVSGALSVDTADMAGVHVNVTLNGGPVESFTGGGMYEYNGYGHGDRLELIAVPEPSTFALAAFGLLGLLGWHWLPRR